MQLVPRQPGRRLRTPYVTWSIVPAGPVALTMRSTPGRAGTRQITPMVCPVLVQAMSPSGIRSDSSIVSMFSAASASRAQPGAPSGLSQPVAYPQSTSAPRRMPIRGTRERLLPTARTASIRPLRLQTRTHGCRVGIGTGVRIPAHRRACRLRAPLCGRGLSL